MPHNKYSDIHSPNKKNSTRNKKTILVKPRVLTLESKYKYHQDTKTDGNGYSNDKI